MRKYSTKELTEEIIKREGVRRLTVEPYEECTVTVGGEVVTLTGPAIVVINQD